jgi:CheY-like chemotaxis protein
MDIQLPEMNGNEVTKIIRTIDKDTPIIAQTAYALKDDIENLMNLLIFRE